MYSDAGYHIGVFFGSGFTLRTPDFLTFEFYQSDISNIAGESLSCQYVITEM